MPKKGDLCAALYTDGLWYRAKVDKVQGNQVVVTYIDYGNKEITNTENLASLPSTYTYLPACAHEYSLAFIKPYDDPENAEDARAEFFNATNGKELLLNVEYKSGLTSYITLMSSDEKEDIGKELVAKGFVFVQKMRERKFQKIGNDYLSAQESAKKARLNLWQYGDVTEDDAKEFG